MNHKVPEIRNRFNYLVEVIARISSRTLTDRLKKMDITPKHFCVLALVDGHHLNQISIAERMHLNRNVMVKLIDDLEKKNLVTREGNPENRREYFIQLTPTGHKVMKDADPLVLENEKCTLQPLTSAEKTTLCDLLRKLVAHHHIDLT